ncbi:MAG: hypothetical protein HUK20_13110 [Fibrobacter sp.]|nr:hypothetical protein [Fibrobacter sp.]
MKFVGNDYCDNYYELTEKEVKRVLDGVLKHIFKLHKDCDKIEHEGLADCNCFVRMTIDITRNKTNDSVEALALHESYHVMVYPEKPGGGCRGFLNHNSRELINKGLAVIAEELQDNTIKVKEYDSGFIRIEVKREDGSKQIKIVDYRKIEAIDEGQGAAILVLSNGHICIDNISADELLNAITPYIYPAPAPIIRR